MTLIVEIMKIIAIPVGEWASWIQETYGVSTDETLAKWKELTGLNIIVKEDENEEVEPVTVEIGGSTSKTSMRIKSKETCQHIFVSGKKTGEQCTTKPKNGAMYCSAHKPKDKTSIKSEKKAKTPKSKEFIDHEFGSDSEAEEAKKAKEPVKKTKAKESTKKVKEAKEAPKAAKSKKKAFEDSDIDYSDQEAFSEPSEKAKPLLKKSKTKTPKKSYNTDEEQIDNNLSLSDSS